MDNETLIKLVTEQVMNMLSQRCTSDSPTTAELPCVLVVGDMSCLTVGDEGKHKFLGLDDYKDCKNIKRYDQVVITQLSFAELADIAMARDAHAASCAVVNALLNGIEVLLYEDALPHRNMTGKRNLVLYKTIEGYVQTLQDYGVKLITKQKALSSSEIKPEKSGEPSETIPGNCDITYSERLITESKALELVKRGDMVKIADSTILTPSARDVFMRAKVKVVRQTQEC